MSGTAYLFVHPLLDSTDLWSGYLVETLADPLTSGQYLARLFQHPDWSGFDKRIPWFIPAIPEAAEPERAGGENVVHVFRQLTPDQPYAVELHEVEEALRHSRHKVALLAVAGNKLPASGAWDYLLLTMSHARSLPPYALLGLSSRTAVVALDLHSHVDLTWAQTNSCQLNTAEFLTARNQQLKKADVARLKLLELLALIARDADTAEIEEVFREQPKLAYSLLRLVNSAANAPRSPVTCFSQAINLLGRRQLQRWLQLLVYADRNDGKNPNPLLQKAATRGRLMELLAQAQGICGNGAQHTDDVAFMVGTFSLLDALLNLPMPEIIEQLPLPEPVRIALVGHDGALGRLLEALSLADARDLSGAQVALQRLGVSSETFLDAQITALHWAAHINTGD